MFKLLRRVFLLMIVAILVVLFFEFKDHPDNFNLDKSVKSKMGQMDVLSQKLKSYINNGIGAINNKIGIISGKNDNKEDNSYKLDSLKNSQDENDNAKNVKLFAGTEDDIIALINKERFDAGVDLLVKNKKLMTSALEKAKDMQKNKYFEHVSEENIQPWFFVEEAGYQYEKFGENIALDYLSANSVHKAFMDSLGHRANILDDNFRDVGIAIFPTETSTGVKYIIVEHFAKALKDVDPEKREKYSDKSKKFCKLQKEKKAEVKKMIKNQQRVIDKFKEEINQKAVEEEEQRLEAMRKIKEKINNYLDDCKELKRKFKKK